MGLTVDPTWKRLPDRQKGMETTPNIERRHIVTRVEVRPGICGNTTTIEARLDGTSCHVSIESACEALQGLAGELTQVDPFQEISFRGEGPLTFRLAAKHCPHPACPVPVAIIKAVEVEAGLALPADVTIELQKLDE